MTLALPKPRRKYISGENTLNKKMSVFLPIRCRSLIGIQFVRTHLFAVKACIFFKCPLIMSKQTFDYPDFYEHFSNFVISKLVKSCPLINGNKIQDRSNLSAHISNTGKCQYKITRVVGPPIYGDVSM